MDAVAKQIKTNCLRLLARREHSREELVDKLRLKGFNRDNILPVLNELAEQGWQSDSRYAESYIREQIRKGYGPLVIAFELNRNAITEVNLDDILLSVADSWQAHLTQVYAKKYQDNHPKSVIELAKRNRFLLQRGFSTAMINNLFTELYGRNLWRSGF